MFSAVFGINVFGAFGKGTAWLPRCYAQRFLVCILDSQMPNHLSLVNALFATLSTDINTYIAICLDDAFGFLCFSA